MSHIYLLGGTSNAGKTTAAAALTARHGLVCAEVDPIRRLLHDRAGPDDPINYFLRPGCEWLDESPGLSLFHKIDVARRTCREGVEPALDRLVLSDRDVLLEGDDLLPEFVEPWSRRGVAGVAFLVLSDTDVIRERYRARDQTRCISRDETRLERFLPHYLDWAEWLASEARQRGLPVVDAGGDTVVDDLAEALGL